ncbi:hypothetical protein [Inhella sp.]|uniref:hypothetical protein n=1 Tax=Inhella sp. TaxID=1921806 RepID=UPI0035B2EC21
MNNLRNGLAVLIASTTAVALALIAPSPAQAASALVLQDSTPLRAAAKHSSPLLTPLWRGEALEIRGAKGDWLQVWDHARERGGFVRAERLLPLPTGEAALPELLAQLRLLRQQAGAESLGLGVAAALIERADADWLAGPQGAELLDALVQLQERLAERVQSAGPNQQTSSAAHAEVAKRYGYPLRSLAQADGSQRLCPNEEPARLLRAHASASAAQQARAALALTRPDCTAAELLPSQLLALHEQRTAWLEGIALNELPPTLRNRLLLRRAGAWASLAFAERARDMRPAATLALQAWGQLIPAELGEDDAAALREAAIRLAPMRHAVQARPAQLRWGKLELRLEAAGPGQTCFQLLEHLRQNAEPRGPRHCSHGAIHWASARLAPDGRSLVLAVQPLDGWTELWRLQADGGLQVLPPSSAAPGLGVAEFAGFIGPQLLVAREAIAEGKSLRRFEVYGPELLQPQRWAGEYALLGAFQRGVDAGWKAGSPLAR